MLCTHSFQHVGKVSPPPTIFESSWMSYNLTQFCHYSPSEGLSCPALPSNSDGDHKPISLEKRMSTHSSILAWTILWTEEPDDYRPLSRKVSLNTTEQLRLWLFTDHQFTSVQSLSHVWLFVTPWTAARQASLSITNSQNLLKLVSIGRWCHPTISSSVVPSPPSFNPSQQQGLFQ